MSKWNPPEETIVADEFVHMPLTRDSQGRLRRRNLIIGPGRELPSNDGWPYTMDHPQPFARGYRGIFALRLSDYRRKYYNTDEFTRMSDGSLDLSSCDKDNSLLVGIIYRKPVLFRTRRMINNLIRLTPFRPDTDFVMGSLFFCVVWVFVFSWLAAFYLGVAVTAILTFVFVVAPLLASSWAYPPEGAGPYTFDLETLYPDVPVFTKWRDAQNFVNNNSDQQALTLSDIGWALPDASRPVKMDTRRLNR